MWPDGLPDPVLLASLHIGKIQYHTSSGSVLRVLECVKSGLRGNQRSAKRDEPSVADV